MKHKIAQQKELSFWKYYLCSILKHYKSCYTVWYLPSNGFFFWHKHQRLVVNRPESFSQRNLRRAKPNFFAKKSEAFSANKKLDSEFNPKNRWATTDTPVGYSWDSKGILQLLRWATPATPLGYYRYSSRVLLIPTGILQLIRWATPATPLGYYSSGVLLILQR